MDNKDISVKIAVATHKEYRMPEDEMYVPFLAGAALRDKDFGYMRDDCIEDNISEKNPNFSELTVLYEAVRVLDAEYIGLAHYRRHFAKEGFSTLENVLINKEDSRFANVLSYEELETLIPSKKIILPKKRNYRVETIFSHYAHTHGEGHLLVAREVISRLCREYLRSFDKVMKSHSAYMFNMMIMRKDLMESYCDWLFPVLFELEKSLTESGMADNLSDFDARLYGRVSERLFNVWLDRMMVTGEISEDEIAELPFVYMEKVDIAKKVLSFANAKLFGKKYNKSF